MACKMARSIRSSTATVPASSLSLMIGRRFGSVPLFEADRVAQSGHRFLERVVLDGAGGHQRGERFGDDIELRR